MLQRPISLKPMIGKLLGYLLGGQPKSIYEIIMRNMSLRGEHFYGYIGSFPALYMSHVLKHEIVALMQVV